MDAKFFKHDGLKLAYYQAGKGGRDLFLQHGIYDDSLCWGPLIDDLAADFRVTLMDARGFGLSERATRGFDLPTIAEDMSALITHLGLEKPVLIGHSMGGSLINCLAAHHPQLVGAAVLVDPAFRVAPRAADIESFMAERTAEHLAMLKLSEAELAAGIRDKHPTWAEAFVLAAAAARLRMSVPALEMFRIIGANWQEDLAKATCPMLLVTADPELGAVVTPETAQLAAKLNPRLRELHIPGAGHSIQREKTAEVLAGIRKFIADMA